MNGIVIEAKNLTKAFPGGIYALRGITLSVHKGERIGIMGHSGAGKTTFLRILNGSLLPTGGHLTVLGTPMGQVTRRQLRKVRSKIAVVQQNNNVIPGMSALHNILMGRLGHCSFPEALRILAFPTRKEKERVYKILEDLEMGDKMFQRCEDLSGGQQQRVAVARALMADPEILLADEPIASVDSRTAGIILDEFFRLNEEKGVTLLINLHQADFAVNFCSRILVFSRGLLIYDGHPQGALEVLHKNPFGVEKGGESFGNPVQKEPSLPAWL